MTLGARIQLIQYLDILIKRKFKGASSDYARRLGISKATFFRLLDFIRNEYHVRLIYNAQSSCYEYEKDGILYFGFVPSNALADQGSKILRDEVRQQNELDKQQASNPDFAFARKYPQ